MIPAKKDQSAAIKSANLSDIEALYDAGGVSSADADRVTDECISMLRRALYIDHRAIGQNHATAVKQSNQKITAIRKALGFSYPKDEISF